MRQTATTSQTNKTDKINNDNKPDKKNKTHKHIATTSQLKYRGKLYLSVVSQGILEEDLHSNNTN